MPKVLFLCENHEKYFSNKTVTTTVKALIPLKEGLKRVPVKRVLDRVQDLNFFFGLSGLD